MLFTRHGAHVPQVTEEGLPTALKPRIAIFRDLGDMAGLLNACGEQIVAGLSSGQGGPFSLLLSNLAKALTTVRMRIYAKPVCSTDLRLSGEL